VTQSRSGVALSMLRLGLGIGVVIMVFAVVNGGCCSRCRSAIRAACSR
jgi:hypothetical protein